MQVYASVPVQFLVVMTQSSRTAAKINDGIKKKAIY